MAVPSGVVSLSTGLSAGATVTVTIARAAPQLHSAHVLRAHYLVPKHWPLGDGSLGPALLTEQKHGEHALNNVPVTVSCRPNARWGDSCTPLSSCRGGA